MNWTWIASFLFSVLRLSTPIIFASQAAAICNKAGVMNMAIESMMLTAALGGVLVSGFTQSALLGFIGAVLCGVAIAAIIAFASFVGKADLYLTNIAMNLAAVGGTIYVLFAFTGEKSSSQGSINSMALPAINIPIIKDIPFIGNVVSGHNIMTYLAILSAFAVSFFVYKTRLGLRLRSVGENPHAAESVGISITKMRFIAYLISGALAACGGAFLSMGYMTGFNRNMTAGRGYIGLAASNMVSGSPIGALLTSLMFGLASATSQQLQMTDAIVDFVQMIPYAVTIIALVVMSIIKKQKANKLVRETVKKEAAA